VRREDGEHGTGNLAVERDEVRRRAADDGTADDGTADDAAADRFLKIFVFILYAI
jgi:hypothetical protein